jgi:hypothetical protein
MGSIERIMGSQVGRARVLAVVGVAGGLGVFDGACSAAPAGTMRDAGGTNADAREVGRLPFTPSNVDLTGMDLSHVGDFVVDNNECTIDTDSNLASCGDGASVLAFKLATQADGTVVALYVARSMTVQSGQNLRVTGSHPFVFVALDMIEVAGTLSANGKGDVETAGGAEVMDQLVGGAGRGGGGAGTATAAGGGGSYCGVGGAGAAESGAASSGGATYGTTEIVPLVAGSSGGAGDGSAGSGGGAIELVAGASITIESTGLVQVGGGGGGFGGVSGQEANGGGSGGALLLESLTVTVAGTLAANGGGGGAGSAADVGSAPPLDPGGANSTPTSTPAAGGKHGVGPSSGGDGSAGGSTNGTPGAFTEGNSAGGGGGGAGRIRINTKTGAATLTSATISPSTSTPCATQGTTP